jgi:crotonobetainyl-CoA:carnitine CoA-transferase CaiB-like acyl-CoA transferase
VENTLAHAQLRQIWELLRADRDSLSQISFNGNDPFYSSAFYLGTTAQVSIGAAALAAAEIWKYRTGKRQSVSIDVRHAAVEFRSERYFRVDGSSAPSLWDPLAGLYPVGDGGFVRIHTNFPHHRDSILKLLACDPTREAVQRALTTWKSLDFEEAANSSGGVVAAIRSRNEWLRHPQARAIQNLPLISIEKIADAEPRPFPVGNRPLSGIKVLDLTRIVAGPVGARALAAYGADVMRVHSPNLPALDWLDRDTGRGKRSAYVDLTSSSDREALIKLIKDADIFMQAYRPESLASKGFGPQELAQTRPGLVYVSLSAYGSVGPWAKRRGFDSLVQTATGFNLAEAQAKGLETPKELPCQALDHASGYLMALGAMIARLRQAQEGGSWHVNISLAQTGNWIWDMGQNPEALKGNDPSFDEIADLIEMKASAFGMVSAVKHSALFSDTTAYWDRPPAPLGTDASYW